MLDVAEEILLGQGYAETTVAAIARAADVSAELIYKGFGGKAGLVRAIQRRGLRGAGPVPAETRSDAISASEPDAAIIIREWATLATEVAPRVSPIMLLIRSAAANDHDLVELLEEIATQRLKRMTHNAERLIRHPDVRPRLSVEQARDILWTYSSPELYQLLVLQRGWTLTAYRDFLFHGMTAQLLNYRMNGEAETPVSRSTTGCLKQVSRASMFRSASLATGGSTSSKTARSHYY